MNISIGTHKDIDTIVKNLSALFNIKQEVINSLVSVNGSLLAKDNNTIVGGVLYAIAINDSADGSIAKVIGMWGDCTSLLLHLNNIITEVHLSTECMQYMKVSTKGTGVWHKLDVLLSKFKSKLHIDKKTFNSKFLELTGIFKDINVDLDKLPRDRNNWFTVGITKKLKLAFSKYITEHSDGVYSFPLFSESTCKELLLQSKEYIYEVNSCEDTPYQMPEVVLIDKDVVLYEKMLEIFNSNIPDITKVLYSAESKNVMSIQLAKYSTGTISKGNWHNDADSDITLVVSLSDDYEGGGTAIKPYGISEEIIIPKLPTGHALLFRGRHFMHKGLPILNGERNILVFWTVS